MPLAPWELPTNLAEALQSLATQTWSVPELVVSSDGPLPEALLTILRESGLPYRLILGPGSEGVGPVLARGLLACSYDLVLRVDSDDLSLPHRCDSQITALLERPDLAAISAPIIEFSHTPIANTAVRRVPQGFASLRRFSLWRNPLNHPAAAIRRSLVLGVGNYRSMPGFEDYDLWLRLLASGELLDNNLEPLVLARAGTSHLARRHGWSYAGREVMFLLRCAKEDLLPVHQVALLILIRPSLRLMPRSVLAGIMAMFRSRGPLVRV